MKRTSSPNSIARARGRVIKMIALAVDQTGQPEGHAARTQLNAALTHHPELERLREVEAFFAWDILRGEIPGLTYGAALTTGMILGAEQLAKEDITGAQFVEMKRAGIDMSGHWEGVGSQAFEAMLRDYAERWRAYRAQAEFRKLLSERIRQAIAGHYYSGGVSL
jgi:hypothetical protein